MFGFWPMHKHLLTMYIAPAKEEIGKMCLRHICFCFLPNQMDTIDISSC